MSETSTLSLPEAARRLGVSVGVLRNAVRAGKIPAPPHLNATCALTSEWFASVEAAIEASPKALVRSSAQKIPPFARYRGTSAWRKYPARVREHARFQAAATGA